METLTNYLWPPGVIECPHCGYDGTEYADCGETFHVLLIDEAHHAVIGVDNTSPEHVHVALAERANMHDYRDAEIECCACNHVFEMPSTLVTEIEDANDWDAHMRKLVGGHVEYLRGQELELGRTINRLPHFLIPAGTRVRIDTWDGGSVCGLRCVERLPELDKWDNVIIVDLEHDGRVATQELLLLRPAGTREAEIARRGTEHHRRLKSELTSLLEESRARPAIRSPRPAIRSPRPAKYQDPTPWDPE